MIKGLLIPSSDFAYWLIIGSYLLCAIFWLLMGAANMKWGNKNSTAGIIVAIIFLIFAATSWHAHFYNQTIVAPEDYSLRAYSAMALALSFFYIAKPYFKHFYRWVNRLFNS